MNTHKVKLAPSILTADFGHLAQQVQEAEAGGADYLHLDVMDGHFVPNMSFGPMVIRSLRQYTSLPFDVHLMVQNPDLLLGDFAEAGADIITVHVETTPHLHRTLQQISDLGCRAGVTINPATPIETLAEVLPMVQQVLIMSVNPGFGGQRFIENSYSKLTRMRALLEAHNPECDLEVDGGIGVGNIKHVVASGANVLVVGSAVYNDKGTVAENLAALRAALAA